MMALLFCQLTNAVSKVEGLREIGESERAGQLGDTVCIYQLPLRRLRMQRGDIVGRNAG